MTLSAAENHATHRSTTADGPSLNVRSPPVAVISQMRQQCPMSREADELIGSLRRTRTLLERYGDRYVAARLADLEGRLEQGDWTAVASAVSEATGSMGSLRDRILSVANGDVIERYQEQKANARLAVLVAEVEQSARSAALALGVQLVR